MPVIDLISVVVAVIKSISDFSDQFQDLIVKHCPQVISNVGVPMRDMQTLTDSHFFRFTIHHDSYYSNWIQLFIDSFITKIL